MNNTTTSVTFNRNDKIQMISLFIIYNTIHVISRYCWYGISILYISQIYKVYPISYYIYTETTWTFQMHVVNQNIPHKITYKIETKKKTVPIHQICKWGCSFDPENHLTKCFTFKALSDVYTLVMLIIYSQPNCLKNNLRLIVNFRYKGMVIFMG